MHRAKDPAEVRTIPRDFISGAFLAAAFENGIGSLAGTRLDALTRSFENQRAKWESEMSVARTGFDGVHRSINDDHEALKRERVTQGEDFKKFLTKLNKDFEDALFAQKDDIEKFKNLVKTQIALLAPVSYWRDKQKGHRRWSKIFGGAVVLAMLGVGAAAWCGLPELLKDVILDRPPQAWRIGVLVVFTTLALWMLRLLVRQLMSHIHLTRDADERVTMVTTYLALMESGKGPDKDMLKSVFDALFRPAADGIVKDEGMPTSLLELLTRRS